MLSTIRATFSDFFKARKAGARGRREKKPAWVSREKRVFTVGRIFDPCFSDFLSAGTGSGVSSVSCNVSSTGQVSCRVTLATALAPNQGNVVEFPLTATAPTTTAGPVINYASVAEDGTSDPPTPDALCIGCGSSAAAVVPAPPPDSDTQA